MDIIQVTATAARVMQWAASEPIPPPIPDYITISSSGTIGFQMRSFKQVQEWAIYLECDYEYREQEMRDGRVQYEIANIGFGDARRIINDPDHGDFRLHVHYNAPIKDEQADTLFDDEAPPVSSASLLPGAIAPEDM